MGLKLLTPDELKPLLRDPEEFKTFKELKDYTRDLHTKYVDPWDDYNMDKGEDIHLLIEETYLEKLMSFSTEEILDYKD